MKYVATFFLTQIDPSRNGVMPNFHDRANEYRIIRDAIKWCFDRYYEPGVNGRWTHCYSHNNATYNFYFRQRDEFVLFSLTWL